MLSAATVTRAAGGTRHASTTLGPPRHRPSSQVPVYACGTGGPISKPSNGSHPPEPIASWPLTVHLRSMAEIPEGLCQCGCGQQTSIAQRTDPKRRAVRGRPVRFVVGHGRRIGTLGKFWAKVDKCGPVPRYRADLGPCWLWLSEKSAKGYGRFVAAGQVRMAHRVAYALTKGPVPEGLQLDHLCRVRDCVNPAHLEPVTNRENTLRGISPHAANARKTHCPQGHPLIEGNLVLTHLRHGRRACLACRHEYNRRKYAELKRLPLPNQHLIAK